jgi:hypothetical protein
MYFRARLHMKYTGTEGTYQRTIDSAPDVASAFRETLGLISLVGWRVREPILQWLTGQGDLRFATAAAEQTRQRGQS